MNRDTDGVWVRIFYLGLDLKLKAWTLCISNFLLLFHHEMKLKRQFKLAQSLSEVTNKNLHGT